MKLNEMSYVPSDQEIQHSIRYLIRMEGTQFVRIRDVCKMLGMATVHSARVASAMRTLGALNPSRMQMKLKRLQ